MHRAWPFRRNHINENSNVLNIPSLKWASGQRSFHYRATKLWDPLPDDMKDPQLDPFKKKIEECASGGFSIFNFYSL